MASEELQKLQVKRGSLKHQLKLFEKSLSSLDSFNLTPDDIQNIQNRLQKIEPIFDIFNELQQEIECLVFKNTSDYELECYERELFQDSYFLIIGKAKLMLDQNEQNLNSAQSHSDLINTIQTHINCLNSLDQPVNEWGGLLVPIITAKLDTQTIKEWETKLNCESSDTDSIPTLDELLGFLNSKQSTLENITLKKTELTRPPHTRVVRSTFSSMNSEEFYCLFCNNNNHSIYQCNKFHQLNSQERNAKVRELKICINCLRKGHFVNECISNSTCRKCTKKHHTLLHLNTFQPRNIETNKLSSNQEVSTTTKTDKELVTNITSLTNCSPINTNSYVLLSTAIVEVKDNQNKIHKIRLLLDSASQSNFVTENLCNKLNLTRDSIQLNVIGIGQSNLKISESVQIEFKSCHNNYANKAKFLIVPTITNALPSFSLNQNAISIPENIHLADPTFNQSASVDMLIGAGIFWSLTCVGQLKQNNIIMQKTKLGWILAGELLNHSIANTSSISCLSLDHLNQKVERFWQVDEFISQKQKLTLDEEYCENYFTTTTNRHTDGKFIVKIPFKPTLSQIGDSYDIAETRFKKLEARFERDPNLKLAYANFINEYINLGHMTKIEDSISTHDNHAFYLPHHCVIKNTNVTTKLRVVFDGSCKPNNGLSINEVQYAGPILQNDIFSIISRFRLHTYVITADIEKMYRQIWIHPTERKYHRILWRDNLNEPLLTYNLNTVTYGTTAAPFLSIRCLKQLALDNINKHPKESQIIIDDFYVDDCITGSDTLESLINIKCNLDKILRSAGFILRKFNSNVPELRDDFSVDKRMLNISDKEQKTLGVFWSPSMDIFTYSFTKLSSKVEVTKRTILSMTAQLYDPLGLLAPIIILAKLIIQELWQLDLGWDETIPMDLYSNWRTFKRSLPFINKICIPRHVLLCNYIRIELHAFADASEKAYGACIYLKSVNERNESLIMLLAAKSRVAPVNTISLPRLELNAAVLSTQLTDKFKSILKLNINKEYYWSDSKITLSWLKSKPNKWKTYVANRVAEVQRLSDFNDWYHVKSSENPADLITRGVYPEQLIQTNLWWNGPLWLSHTWENYPNDTISLTIQEKSLMEPRSDVQIFHVINEISFPINTFSSFSKLQRVTAYCLRFKNNALNKTNRNYGHLTVQELSTALNSLIRVVQRTSFPQDYHQLENQKPLHCKSNLLSLTPFLDSHKLMRVGGRLKLSNYNYDKKHPILLPKQNYFTELLFRYKHEQLLHAGPKSLLSAVHEQFWPIAGKNIAKRIVRNCIRCFKFNSKPVNQIMGELPKERILSTYPFHTTGVDYAGPYLFRDRLGRGKRM